MNVYITAARLALKFGMNVRALEQKLRKLGASKNEARRAISIAKGRA